MSENKNRLEEGFLRPLFFSSSLLPLTACTFISLSYELLCPHFIFSNPIFMHSSNFSVFPYVKVSPPHSDTPIFKIPWLYLKQRLPTSSNFKATAEPIICF